MKTNLSRKWVRLAVCGVCCAASGVWALTPAQLQALIDDGEKVTIIDIRIRSLYQSGHVPNAISVPAHVLARKRLPGLGRVVVYGRGLGTDDIDEAVRLLNEKPGIEAEALDGGYAAWEMNRGTTTQSAGVRAEQLNYITYQNLAELKADQVVLVDLRKQPEASSDTLTRQGEPAEPPALTSLTEKFPGRTVVNSPFAVGAVASRSSEGGMSRQADEPVPVMVLIDSGDGEAEKTARILRANGIKRVVILAGGEEILKRDGASGLARLGMDSQTVEDRHE